MKKFVEFKTIVYKENNVGEKLRDLGIDSYEDDVQEEIVSVAIDLNKISQVWETRTKLENKDVICCIAIAEEWKSPVLLITYKEFKQILIDKEVWI